jgi:hypothetical protein
MILDTTEESASSRASAARDAMQEILGSLAFYGWVKVLPWRYINHTGVVIETGYVYGESRATCFTINGIVLADFRFNGMPADQEKMDLLREVYIAAP